MQNKIIAFAHVPKTAGTSLKYLLRRYFGISQLDAIYRKGAPNAAYLPKDYRKDIRFRPRVKIVAGHCMKPFVDFEEFDSQMSWFTFLRDPVKRYISHYIHEQTGGNEKYFMDMFQWAKKFKRKDWTVRMFAGERNLEKAKEILATKIDFIGRTEEFTKSMELFVKYYQLRGFDTTLSKRKMVIRNQQIKKDISDNYEKYENLLLSQNELDIALYDFFVKELWATQNERIDKFILPEGNSPNHYINLYTAKIYRNVVYKPLVKIEQLR